MLLSGMVLDGSKEIRASISMELKEPELLASLEPISRVFADLKGSATCSLSDSAPVSSPGAY